MYYTTQNKHKKAKSRFSHLIRHPAWKWRRPILVSALHKLVTYLDTYPLTYSPGTYAGLELGWIVTECRPRIAFKHLT